MGQEPKENILDELTAKLGTLEALLDSLERNKAARSPGFTVGFPTPSTSDLSSSSSCSRSASPLTGIASISFDLSEATSEDGETTSKDIFEQDSLESYSNSLASSASSSSASSLSLSLASSSSPLISDSALVQEIRQIEISSNEKEDHGICSASSNSPEENTNNSLRRRSLSTCSSLSDDFSRGGLKTNEHQLAAFSAATKIKSGMKNNFELESRFSNSTVAKNSNNANLFVRKCELASQKLRGYYEERKELDANLEELLQRLSFWSSLEKSNRFLILKEIENALVLFEMSKCHQNNNSQQIPKIKSCKIESPKSPAIDPNNKQAPVQVNQLKNPDKSSISHNSQISWLYFIIACLLIFILFTGIDFHCPYQIV